MNNSLSKHIDDKNKTIIYKIFLFFFIVLIGESLFFDFFLSKTTIYNILKTEIVVLFVVALWSLKLLQIPRFHFYTMFLWMFFMFVISRIFLDLIGHSNLNYTFQFKKWTFDEEILNEGLFNVLFAFVSLHLGAIFATFKYDFSYKKMTFNKKWFVYSIIIIVSLFAIIVFYKIKPIIFLLNNGYMAYQKGFFIKGFLNFIAENIIWTFIFVYIASFPKKMAFIYMFVLVILPLLLLEIMTGIRGGVMTKLIIIIIVYLFYYRIEISLLRIILFLIFGVFSMVFIQFYRNGSSGFTDLLNFYTIKGFLFSQGYTINTLFYAIEYKSVLYDDFNITNMFSSLFELIHKGYIRLVGLPELSLVEKADKFGYSGFIITKEANVSSITGGHTMGSSYITELYLWGKIKAQVVFGALLGYSFIKYFNKYFFTNVGVFIFLLIGPNLLYIPRYALFAFISNNIVELVIFLIFINIVKRV